MGAKTSPEMLKAREHILRGASAYEAAKLSGVTRSAIYMSKWYKEFKHAQQTRNCTPQR